jgi:hypothetical protein
VTFPRHCETGSTSAVSSDDRRPILGGHFCDRGSMFGRYSLEQGRFPDPAELGEVAAIDGELIIPDDAAIPLLVIRDEAEVGSDDALGTTNGFPMS